MLRPMDKKIFFLKIYAENFCLYGLFLNYSLISMNQNETWRRGYKSFFMLNSTEHEIYAHKCLNAINCWHFNLLA